MQAEPVLDVELWAHWVCFRVVDIISPTFYVECDSGTDLVGFGLRLYSI